MLRSMLGNKYNEDRTAENLNKFRKQRNSCVKLFRKERRNYLEAWYSDDEACLLRNVNHNKYGLVFQLNVSLGFVLHGFVIIFTWICQNWNELHEHEYRRNSCSSFSNYYNNLDISHVTDNKKFWKTVKP